MNESAPHLKQAPSYLPTKPELFTFPDGHVFENLLVKGDKRKFVIGTDGKVHIGDNGENHFLIAHRNGTGLHTTASGGIMDFGSRIISGRSHIFLGYDQKYLQLLLPDWTVLPSE
jgi:hypothetical protein